MTKGEGDVFVLEPPLDRLATRTDPDEVVEFNLSIGMVDPPARVCALAVWPSAGSAEPAVEGHDSLTRRAQLPFLQKNGPPGPSQTTNVRLGGAWQRLGDAGLNYQRRPTLRLTSSGLSIWWYKTIIRFFSLVCSHFWPPYVCVMTFVWRWLNTH